MYFFYNPVSVLNADRVYNLIQCYFFTDHLGTSTALTDFNGNAYQFFLNLPFGETMAQQLGSNYYNSPYKFNGKELDEETGFYYYGARYYDPRISIWQSVDPLAEKYPNWSPYNYCKQSPISRYDPDGRDDIFTATGRFVKHVNNDTNNIIIQNGGSPQLFSKFSANKKNSLASAKIIAYYARQIGINGTVGMSPSLESKKKLAYNRGEGIYVTSKGGVNPLFNDSNNLINSLHHEKDHMSNKHSYRTITFNEHANVYLGQMDEGKGFDITTPSYREGQAGSFAEYVLSAHYKENANSTDLVNSYNSKSIDYKLSLEHDYKLDNQGNILETKLYINVTDSKGNTRRIDYDKNKKTE